jgi:hypothetical protein
MAMLAGVVYQPVLKLTDPRGIPQKYFGDPIQLDVLQFDQDGVRHVEFRNDVLFQRETADLAMDAVPLVRSLLNIMRENLGSSIVSWFMKRKAGAPWRKNEEKN